MNEMTPLPRPPRRFRYHVLFSYAGEDSEYVTAVHHALPKEVKVFNYAEGEMWGERLAKGIERRYKNEAPFCVVFISEDYLAKDWTKKELSIVVSVNNEKPGYMLPVMLRGAIPPPEIKGIVWLDEKLSADELAAHIVGKLRDPPPTPWWFFITTTEVKIAAAVLLLAVILWFWPSRTTLKSAHANEEGIIAHVVNVSPKSSTLVGQRLRFGSLPIEDSELGLESESPTIFPGEHDVKLTTSELVTKCGADGFLVTEYNVEPLLGNQPVTLEIDIRESDDAPGKSRQKIMTFPAADLKPLVRKVVSGHVTLCRQYSRLRSARSDSGARRNHD